MLQTSLAVTALLILGLTTIPTHADELPIEIPVGSSGKPDTGFFLPSQGQEVTLEFNGHAGFDYFLGMGIYGANLLVQISDPAGVTVASFQIPPNDQYTLQRGVEIHASMDGS